MMGKTHLAVGMAAALAAAPFTDLSGCFLVLSCGAVGGVLPDVDALDRRHQGDLLRGVSVAVCALLLAGAADLLQGWRLLDTLAEQMQMTLLGGAAFLLLWRLGMLSGHRGFTHSLLALLLFSGSVWMIHRPLVVPFAAAYGSHLLLDLLNHRGIRLFFPLRRRLCLGLCYSDKKADLVCLVLGHIAAPLLLIFRLIGMM